MWNLEKYANNIAIICESDEKITYGDLLFRVERLAAQVDERCLVFCLCENCEGSLLGYVTFLNNKIVPLMLDAQIDRQLLTGLADVYRPGYYWIPSGMVSAFESYRAVYSDYNYTLMKTDYHCETPFFEDLALLLTTSGSTGSRKIVRQSYANIKSNIEAIVQYLEIDETDRSITTLPMNYTFGLSIINSHLYTGASIVLTEKTLVERGFWQQFKVYDVTTFGGVPYTYEMLHRMRFTKMQLPSLRSMIQAGGKLMPELQKNFTQYASKHGKRFYVMYGQTEATARMSYLPYHKSYEKIGSIGVAIPNGKLSLIDESGMEITGTDTVGQLVYEGPNVMLGYAEHRRDLIKSDECNGRLFTGDLAKVDKDGYFWITGRKKRFLKIFGNRVNLDGTEQLLKVKFGETEIACHGVDNKMYIFITDESLVCDVEQYVIKKTKLNHIAFTVNYLNKIAKNESGKVIYQDLEKYFT